MSNGSKVHTDIQMNRNKITFLDDPSHFHEATTKQYVDRKVRSLYFLSHEGHIPQLVDSVSKTGFIASSSSLLNVFRDNNWYPFNSARQREWKPAGDGVGEWIQIKCPYAVEIWKIRLTGPLENAGRITSWKLSAKMRDSDQLADIYASDETLGPRMQEFAIDSMNTKYKTYRITILRVEEGTVETGISYFQIFIKSRAKAWD